MWRGQQWRMTHPSVHDAMPLPSEVLGASIVQVRQFPKFHFP